MLCCFESNVSAPLLDSPFVVERTENSRGGIRRASACRHQVLPDILSRSATLCRWLNNNELKEVPQVLGALTNLCTLRLSGNQLSTLPEQLTRLGKLQTL